MRGQLSISYGIRLGSGFYQVSWFILLGSSVFGFYFGSILVISSGHCCVYLFGVLFGERSFPYGSIFSLSFVFVRNASVLRTDSLVEGLSSSTRAKTRLRLTFAASFLFHFSSAFLFYCFGPSVPQVRLSNEIYAGTLICSARLLAFMGVTLLYYNLFSLSFSS